MHHHDRRLSAIVLVGGLTGLLTGLGLQEWVHEIAYPTNVAGKPLNSWPQFIPVTFEMTILFAAIAAVIGMIVLNGLPMPYHPVFNVERFEHASRDKFFLLVESADPKFDRRRTLELLKGLNASEINEVRRSRHGARCPYEGPDPGCLLRRRCGAALALSSAAGRACRQDMHNQPSTIPLRDERFFKDGSSARPLVEDTVARGTLQEDAAFFTGKSERRRVATLPVAADAGGPGSRRAALQHLLRALPRPHRQRQRNDRAARLPAAAVVPRRPAAAGADRPFLRRHDQRVRRDARLPGADRAARSLGDRGLHPRAATEPARDRVATCRPRIARSSRSPPARRRRARSSTNADHSSPNGVRRNSIACSSAAWWSASRVWSLGAIGAFLNPAQFLPSWLIGFALCLGLTLGSLGAADAAAHDRRTVGPGVAAHLRGGDPADSVLPGAVHPDRRDVAEAVHLGAARCGRRRRDPAIQADLPERAVLPDSGRRLLSGLVRLCLLPEQMVAGAGRRVRSPSPRPTPDASG